MMGGRVAEQLFLDQLTTGASNDLERATKMARKMVCEWGMSDTFGSMALSDNGNEVFLGRELVQHKHYSEETARLIDSEVKRIVQAAYDKAKELLQGNEQIMYNLAEALLERETLTGEELNKIMEGEPLPPFEKAANVRPEPAASAEEDDSDRHGEDQDDDVAEEQESESEQEDGPEFQIEEDDDEDEHDADREK
jgi:cell division protease FtsH